MTTVPVTISITRSNNGAKATVDPFVVTINLGDEVQWKLESDFPDSSAIIERKNPGDDWPFETDPPKDIKKGNPKKSGKTKKDAKKENRYNVKCSFLDGKTPTDVLVDPDIIIIGGSLE